MTTQVVYLFAGLQWIAFVVVALLRRATARRVVGASLALPGTRARGEVVFAEAELQIDCGPQQLAKDGPPVAGVWVYRLEKAAAVEE